MKILGPFRSWYQNHNMRRKILLLAGLGAFGIAFTTLLFLQSVREVDRARLEAVDHRIKTSTINDVYIGFLELETYKLSYQSLIESGETEVAREILRERDVLKITLRESIEKLLNSIDEDRYATSLAELDGNLTLFINYQDLIIDNLYSGFRLDNLPPEERLQISQAGMERLEAASQRTLNASRFLLRDLSRNISIRSEAAEVAFLERRNAVLRLSMIVALFLLAIISLGGFLAGRSIASRIEGITRRMSDLASGANAVPVTAMDSADEIGTLERAFEVFRGNALDLKKTLDTLRLAQTAGDFGVWQWDPGTGQLVWDVRNLGLHGVDPKAFNNGYSDWANTVHADDLDRVERAFRDLIERDLPFHTQYRVRTADGKIRHLSGNAVAVRDAAGIAIQVVGVNFDKTESVLRETELVMAREAAERATSQMEYDATHDTLTDLHNRRALDLHLRSLSEDLDDEAAVAFLQIDLDRFKSINDAFGHLIGDFVLTETARILKEFEDEQLFVARLGGDEFAIVLAGGDVRSQAERVARQIIAKCGQPLTYKNILLHYGASIGIAHGTRTSVGSLHENADIALYVAKRSKGESFSVFDTAMRQDAERHKRIADGLRVALQDDQLLVHFQPKLIAGTHEIAGLEALVRWRHPTLGLIPPHEFLPIAEEIGLGQEIDQRVLRLTLETVHRLIDADLAVPQMAVNVGLQRLRDPFLLEEIDGLGDFPCELVFEVLETVDLDAVHNELKWVLDGLRERGVKLEVDDFGTAHASITSILRLQPDGVKLDRSLIAGVEGMQMASEDLLRALIDIGRAAEIRVTAEGVETEAQMHLLEQLGCDVLQGFLFAKPMGEADLIDWLAQKYGRKRALPMQS